MPKFAELTPDTLMPHVERNAVFVLPWGALEWHGSHLPLGLDGFTAEHFAEKLCERVDGVLLPTFWVPMTTLPHAASLQVSTATFVAVVRETLEGLKGLGVRKICIVTGHYAQGHMVELYQIAESFLPELAVYVASPLEPIGNEELLDHAARYETSQLLAVRPELVDLDNLTSEMEAVLGPDPRLGSVEEGETLLEAGLEAWEDWLELDSGKLGEHYVKAKAQYDEYRDKYFKESWEQAIQDWWAEHLAK